MQIKFDDSYKEDMNRSLVAFYADVEGSRVICAISVEALQDHFGLEGAGDPCACFENNRGVIQALARKRIESGDLGPSRRVCITTMDIGISRNRVKGLGTGDV